MAQAYWLDYGMSFVSGPAQWRLPIGFQAVFALCLLLQVLVLPDSPRWCMAHGREEEGARILAQLEGCDSPDHPDVVAKRKEIEVSLAQESAGGPFRYRELLQGGPLGNFRRICLCIGVNVMQQFTGYVPTPIALRAVSNKPHSANMIKYIPCHDYQPHANTYIYIAATSRLSYTRTQWACQEISRLSSAASQR